MERAPHKKSRPPIGRAAALLLSAVLGVATCEAPPAGKTETAVTIQAAPPAKATNCAEQNNAEAAAIADTLYAQLRGKLINRAVWRTTAQTREAARKYNVPLLQADAYFDSIAKAEDNESAAAILNEMTTRYYGFRTSVYAGDPDQTRRDISNFALKLDPLPPPLVWKLGINQVYLMSPEPAHVLIDGKSAGAFTYAHPKDTVNPRDIHLAPGNASSFEHELAHQAQRVFVTQTCVDPSLNYDPSFSAHNPAHFRYKNPPMRWKGITVNDYAAKHLTEDVAETSEALMTPTAASCEAVQNSPVIAQKVGTIAVRFNELAPGTGSYYALLFSKRCV